MKAQARYIYHNIAKILKAGGCSLEDLIRVEQFIAEHDQFPYYLEAQHEFLLKERPTSTAVCANHLEVPGALCVCDVISVVPGFGHRKETFTTDKIPQPLARYSLSSRWGICVLTREHCLRL